MANKANLLIPICRSYLVSSLETVVDTILGRWKSQILYAGVKLEIFESLQEDTKHASEVSKELGLYP